MENWKEVNIPDRPYYTYEVSDKGRVRNDRGEILKPTFNKGNGYYYISLHYNGKATTYSLHKLVALTFVKNPDSTKYTVINHKDEDKMNNCADNLEWCTYKYNANYGTATERMSKSLLSNDNDKKVPIIVIVKSPFSQHEFNSIRGASRFSGVSRRTIGMRLSNPEVYTNEFKNYVFMYKNPDRVLHADVYQVDSGTHGVNNPHRRQTVSDIKKRLIDLHSSLEFIDEDFKGILHSKAKFKCTICGSVFTKEINSVLNFGQGCPLCSRKKLAIKRTATQSESQNRLNDTFNNNIIILDGYIGSTSPCTMQCKNCGTVFTGVVARLVNNGKQKDYQGNGCEHCSKSRYRTISNLRRYHHTEEEIEQRLKEKHLWW